jgi:hypothetical protein
MPLTRHHTPEAYLRAVGIVGTVALLFLIYFLLAMHWRNKTASQENSLLLAFERLGLGKTKEQKLY